VSAARPKIADYPFTTLVPNLGVVMTRDKESFVIADIPGLIEGAHQGTGLGHDFLRHIERTRVLLYILDAAETEGRSVLNDLAALQKELQLYNADLINRPFLIAANKMDLPGSEKNLAELQKQYGDRVYGISAVSGQGTEELMEKTYAILKTVHIEKHVGEVRVNRRYEEEIPFTIEVENGIYRVKGKRIEDLVVMTNFDQDESLQKFQRAIKHMGLEEALREKGIKPGDLVRIKEMELEYSE
jgi:GTP-binding protein